jgi:hypothetical protein
MYDEIVLYGKPLGFNESQVFSSFLCLSSHWRSNSCEYTNEQHPMAVLIYNSATMLEQDKIQAVDNSVALAVYDMFSMNCV